MTGISDDILRRRVLVTGASGFIGSHLCRRFAAAGAEVHAVSRRPAGEHTSGSVRWWQDDLLDLERLEGLLAKVRPELIFHLAAEVSGTRELDAVATMLRSNLEASVNLMIAATKQVCERLVIAGSLEEPGAEAGVAVSPYAAAKGAASSYAEMMHALYGTPVVNARLFMVYGPGQRDLRKLVPYSILSYLQGEPPRIQSSGRAVDWIYVDDVVEGLIACATGDGLSGTTVDIGSGRLHAVGDVVEEIRHGMGEAAAPAFGEKQPAYTERVRVADIEDAYARTGWRARIDLSEGLSRTITWYREAVGNGTIHLAP